MANKVSYRSMTLGSILTRFITSILVLFIISYFTPGFITNSFGILILASIVLTILDYLTNTIFNIKVSNLSTGIIGFILSAIVIYLVQFFVPSLEISFLAAIIGAAIYGVAALIVP